MLHIMKFWILLRHIPPIINFGYAQDSRRAADMAAPATAVRFSNRPATSCGRDLTG